VSDRIIRAELIAERTVSEFIFSLFCVDKIARDIIQAKLTHLFV